MFFIPKISYKVNSYVLCIQHLVLRFRVIYSLPPNGMKCIVLHVKYFIVYLTTKNNFYIQKTFEVFQRKPKSNPK